MWGRFCPAELTKSGPPAGCPLVAIEGIDIDLRLTELDTLGTGGLEWTNGV